MMQTIHCNGSLAYDLCLIVNLSVKSRFKYGQIRSCITVFAYSISLLIRVIGKSELDKDFAVHMSTNQKEVPCLLTSSFFIFLQEAGVNSNLEW